VGIQALPSLKDRAVLPGSLNDADLEISKLQKKVVALNAKSRRCRCWATPPIPPSYWDSPKAWGLFQPGPEKPVQECLQRQVNLLNSAFNAWSNLNEVVEGGKEMISRLTDHQETRTQVSLLPCGL
jgi:hypothetical protein